MNNQKRTISSEKESLALLKLIRNGNQQSLEKLTKSYLPLIESIARHYQAQGMEHEDLVNEGFIGMNTAIEKFDVDKGGSFHSFCTKHIRQSIVEAIARQSRMVRIPRKRIASSKKINKALHIFEQQHERRPSVNEISLSTNLSEERVKETITATRKHISIDAPLTFSAGSNLLSKIINIDSPLADDEAISNSLREEIIKGMKTLSCREQTIIASCFGIGCEEKTMAEIAQEMCLTRERIRQIRKKAFRKLRKATDNKMLKTYL